ncbi:hypothetical protein SH661x_001632 [Planctomicrobium sp. SH661]|uniref:hypothetical protein n=1 Tax=Planctomicrobium sp. SH661 TaxID=3448124 RepID=UPI003F5BE21A
MRVVSFVVSLIVLASSIVLAEEKPEKAEKPISELQFCKDLIEFNRKVKVTGTAVNRDAQRQENWVAFNERFQPFEIEIDGVISEVKWSQGWAEIHYSSRTPASFLKAATFAAHRILPIECEADAVKHLKRGDRISVRASLFIQQDGSVAQPSVWSPDASAVFYFVAGRKFVSRKFEVQVGKESFTFDQGEQK